MKEKLIQEYKQLSSLNTNHSFKIDYENKNITVTDSKVYDYRDLGYFYNSGVILYLGMTWKELEVITKLYNYLFKDMETNNEM